MDTSAKKEIKIVSGNGKNLKISPVSDYIDIEKPNKEKEKKSAMEVVMTVLPDSYTHLRENETRHEILCINIH